jgi:transposase-like protein
MANIGLKARNYLRKTCGHQFISLHDVTYRRCLPAVINLVKIMLVWGIGIRDISAALSIGSATVLKILTSTTYTIQPQSSHYDCLEMTSFGIWREEKEQRMAYLCLSPGQWRDRGVCLRETGDKDG